MHTERPLGVAFDQTNNVAEASCLDIEMLMSASSNVGSVLVVMNNAGEKEVDRIVGSEAAEGCNFAEKIVAQSKGGLLVELDSVEQLTGEKRNAGDSGGSQNTARPEDHANNQERADEVGHESELHHGLQLLVSPLQ